MCPAYEMTAGHFARCDISRMLLLGIPELATAAGIPADSGSCMAVQQVRAEADGEAHMYAKRGKTSLKFR